MKGKLEVEGKEILIKSSDGTMAVIPKDKVSMVKGYIDSGNHGMVDKFVSTLKEFKHNNQKAGDGLYANIRAKRARIAAGSGERMRKAGDAGAPTAAQFKQAAKTAKAEDGMVIPPTEERKPIAVTNPNDPRLKAYRDSLNVNDLQKYEIANWNQLVKMTPAERNDFYNKKNISERIDPKQLRYNQKTSMYNLNVPDKDLNMIGTNQYIDSPGIRHFKPKPFPAPEQPIVLVKQKKIIVPADIQPKQVSTNITSDIEKREPAPIPAFIKRNIAEKSPSLAYPAQNQNFFERMRSKITGETPMPYWIDKQGIKRYPSKGESSPKAVKEIAMLKEGLDPKVPEDAAELKRIDYLLGKKNKQVLKAIENPKK